MTATGVVYRAYAADDRLLYIGSTANPERRVRRHQRGAEWASEVARWSYEEYPTLEAARAAEKAAIWDESPECNVDGLDPAVARERQKAEFRKIAKATVDDW